MKQVYIVRDRATGRPTGAYASFDNAAAVFDALDLDVSEIVAVPVLDSDVGVVFDSYPFDSMARWLQRNGGEKDGV